MTPTASPFDFQVHNPATDAVGNALTWLLGHWWALIIVVPLFIIFIAHRTLWTRYGTDPQWKQSSELDQILEYEKQEHPTLEEDEHLPTNHWDI